MAKDYKYDKEGNMNAYVEDMSKPEGCYSQHFDQAPLNYMDRQNKTQMHESNKLKKEKYKYDRYSK